MIPKARTAIAALALSAAGLVGLALNEGFTDTAVQPLPGDAWTYGFGTTTHSDGTPVRKGEKIAPPQALARKLEDIQRFEGAVKQCVAVPLYQHEYDAYLSFSYNVGPAAFCNSTMVRLLNQERYAEACAEFDRWTFYRGKDCRDPANKCRGLANRRAQERAKCEGK